MKIFYLNSTHWDREWYVPFQHFRYNLVDTLNELIDILETDPEYKLFCMDGQTIVLEDYAEIEPENAQKLRAFIESGRVLVGPWYVMPDEFLVSGESLIKNLATGHALAEKWGGKPWKYGYANDIFGHIAQMPQIFKGFSIEGAYIGRGLGNTEYNHFVWCSPDGTECFTSIGFYGAFIVGKMKHFGSEEFPEMLKNWVDLAIGRSEAPVAFFSNTNDHVRPDRRTPEVLRMIRELYPDAEVCDVSLTEMVEELKKHREKLPTVVGELNEPRESLSPDSKNLTLLYHCLSAHYPIKQQNDRCQNLLENRIEPMCAFASLEGRPLNRRFVDTAYRWLLQNHPHDSICGCSGDRVHGQMRYRFEQAEDIAQRLFEAFCDGEAVVSGDGDKTDYIIKIYNTLPKTVDKVHTVKLSMKSFSTVRQGYALKEDHNNFRLLDSDGQEIPYQINSIARDRLVRTSSTAQKFTRADVYTISFKAAVPAMGSAAFRIVPEEKRVAFGDKMPCGNSWAENELIKLNILPNGRLEITDKRTNKVYSELCALADNGEVGDGWRHESPMNDFTVSDLGAAADISLVSSGAAQTVFKVTKVLNVPECLDGKTLSRSERTVPLKVTSTVTLNRGSAAVEVKTEIENNARDHRLKVLFPSSVEGESYFAGQAFYKVERHVGIDPEKLTWDEQECVEKNMNGIVGKQDKSGNGIGIVSAEGLHEAGVLEDADGTVAVTLYRCFDRVFMQTEATMPQLQEKLEFKYAIVPLTADTSYADLLTVQHALKGVDMVMSQKVSADTATPAPKSYFELDNSDIVLSMFKVADDGKGYVVRMFNASSVPSTVRLSPSFRFETAAETDLLENVTAELPQFDGELKLIFRPWEIKTVKLF